LRVRWLRPRSSLNKPLFGIEPAKPKSREDVLGDRLRSLRNTSEKDLGTPTPGAASSQPDPALSLTRSAALHKGGDSDTFPAKLPPSSETHGGTYVDVDRLLQTDDQILEDLLEDIGPEDQWTFDDAGAESNRVEALLEELSKASVQQSRSSHDDKKAKDRGHASDDSDGEEMTREVENILSKAADEAKFDPGPAEKPQEVPGDAQSQVSTGGDDDGGGDPADFSLPSVPSKLVGPQQAEDPTGKTPIPGKILKPGDFEEEMAARMAALRGLGSAAVKDEDDAGLELPSVPNDDGLELPSVPTSMPSAGPKVNRVATTTGYTDEDMETWCVACMEDGTLICAGCDDDVFCARCWHDLHRGPLAGYEESTHRPKQFNRKKKIAVGAS
jgi:hypothetical protein